VLPQRMFYRQKNFVCDSTVRPVIPTKYVSWPSGVIANRQNRQVGSVPQHMFSEWSLYRL